MKLEIDLTDDEVFFLKQYASVYNAERRIDCTRDPLVQVLVCDDKVTDEDFADYSIIVDEDNDYQEIEHSYDSVIRYLSERIYETEVVEFLTNEESELLFDAWLDIENDGQYLNEEYGIDLKVRHMMKHERAVAYFLTRAEAEKYCIYQSHNLNKPRVFTTYTGYSNRGDLTCLKEMLIRVGNELVSQ